MTISQLLDKSTKQLNKNKMQNPLFEAELLLSHVLKKSREYILAHPEKLLTKTLISNYHKLINKRLKGIPLAYIVGYKYFYGLKFLVNKNVLIPRPETELMVDEALKLLHSKKSTTIIDVGTGSGCIIISIATKMSFGYPKLIFNYFATDISKLALEVAKKNAKIHKVNKKISFRQGNLLEPFLKNKLKIDNCKLIIICNLPYLIPKQLKNSPTIQFEPKLALSGGQDGLRYYRKLLKQIGRLCNKLYVIGYMLIEVDPSQSKEIKKLVKHHLPNSKIQIKKDLRGLNRLVIIRINK